MRTIPRDWIWDAIELTYEGSIRADRHKMSNDCGFAGVELHRIGIYREIKRRFHSPFEIGRCFCEIGPWHSPRSNEIVVSCSIRSPKAKTAVAQLEISHSIPCLASPNEPYHWLAPLSVQQHEKVIVTGQSCQSLKCSLRFSRSVKYVDLMYKAALSTSNFTSFPYKHFISQNTTQLSILKNGFPLQSCGSLGNLLFVHQRPSNNLRQFVSVPSRTPRKHLRIIILRLLRSQYLLRH